MAGHGRRCPVCLSPSVSVFAEIRDVPVHCNLLWKTREQAEKAGRGDIRLGFCQGCGHIFNTAFDGELVRYSTEYENSLHFSPCFQDYARALAVRLIERHNLYGKDIIEIGCGKGDFLLLLSELGGNRGIGFDASYIEDRGANSEQRVVFIQDLYSEQYSAYKGDMVCSRQVLEHIESPRDFMLSMRSAIGSRPDTVVFFEVPNFSYTIRELAVWDIIYEHYSYFSSLSLKRLFHETGFRVLSCDESFEGQFLCIEALPGCGPTEERCEKGRTALKREAAAFARRYATKVISWKSELERIAVRGQKAVLWGGGSKGVSFLNAFKPPEGLISCVVDINPRKHGKFIPVTGQEIVGPETLAEYRPDVIIVMNHVYIGEIWEMIKAIGLKSRILTA